MATRCAKTVARGFTLYTHKDEYCATKNLMLEWGDREEEVVAYNDGQNVGPCLIELTSAARGSLDAGSRIIEPIFFTIHVL